MFSVASVLSFLSSTYLNLLPRLILRVKIRTISKLKQENPGNSIVTVAELRRPSSV